MSACPDSTHAPFPAPPAGAPASDDPGAWRERQLAILSELAEAGLEIALALKTRIVETAAAEPDPGSARACADLSRAFDRASRAVRMSIALRERLLKGAPFAAQATRDAAHEGRTLRAGRVRRIVQRIAKARYSDGPTREAMDRIASERLYDTDITGDLANRSIGALVAQICADLGLSPPWMAMAQEAWAQAEIAERPPASPYAAWPDLPPDEPDPERPDPDDDDLWDSDDDFDDPDAGEDEPDDPGGGDP